MKVRKEEIRKAEAEEMRAKSYTYQQETARQVGMEAMKNGIVGDGSGGSLRELASLGITLRALGGVANMTKEVMTPVLHDCTQIGTGVVPENENKTTEKVWSCSCGKTNISTPFCPECGAKCPEPQQTWTCSCGAANLTSRFCPECGSMRRTKDEEKNISILSVYGIAFLMYCVLFLAIPFEKTGAVIPAFLFSVLALILGMLVVLYAAQKGETLQ